MRAPNWSIRTKLVVLLLPPLVTLLAMWIFTTSLTFGDARVLFSASALHQDAGMPADRVNFELQRERRLALQYLGGGRTDARPLLEQRQKTDAVVAQYRQRTTGKRLRDAASAYTERRVDETLDALDTLGRIRAAVDAGQIDRVTVLRQYSEITDAVYRMLEALIASIEEETTRYAQTATVLSHSRELLAREDALIHGAAAAGRFAPGEHAELVKLIGIQRFIYASAIPNLPDSGRAAYDRALADDSFVRIRAMEDRLVNEVRANGSVPIDLATWRGAYDLAIERFRAAANSAGEDIVRMAQPIGTAIVVRLLVAAVVGFIAIVVSVVLAIRVGRSLVRRLGRLRRIADHLAERELPDTVSRLRRGEDVELPERIPDLELGADEIGQVASSFGKVQQTALDSAVQEARLRKGISEIFLNLARRSQTLVHRQLSMLDRMERRASNPEELEDLFRVDHLATRMRRHAEDLVIIAGAAPGRGWRNPVPLVDVIRGAVSEVEDYARCVFTAIPDASLVGRAVADVIHLLAEIIENATSFSPPHTRVQIAGQVVPNGFALEIEDRGLGMTPEAIEDANERLLNPPDFDPANSARLGLFVVALLAARHGIRVTLRSSAYGGISAVVLIPKDLIVTGSEPAALPAARFGEESGPMASILVLEPAGNDSERGGRHARHAAARNAVPIQRAITAPTPVSPPTIPVSPQVVPVHTDSSTADISAPNGQLLEDGLPRRQRQANLAPQLRTPRAPAPSVPTPQPQPATEPADRSPEETRAIMSSFQAGLTRGRHDAATTLDVGGQHDEERD